MLEARGRWQLAQFELEAGFSSIAFAGNGSSLLVHRTFLFRPDSSLEHADLRTRQLSHVTLGASTFVVSGDGRSAATRDADGGATLWTLPGRRPWLTILLVSLLSTLFVLSLIATTPLGRGHAHQAQTAATASRPPRVAILALLLLLQIGLLLAVWATARAEWFIWPRRNACFLVVFSEVGMVWAWAALSRTRLSIKLLTVGGGLAAAWAMLRTIDRQITPLVLVESLALSGTVIMPCALAIYSWAQARGRGGWNGWQFSTRQLLILIVAIGMVVTLLQLLWRDELTAYPPRILSGAAQMSVVLMLWSVLPRGRRVLRLAVATVLVCVLGIAATSIAAESRLITFLQPFTFQAGPLIAAALLGPLLAAVTIRCLMDREELTHLFTSPGRHEREDD